MKIKVFHWGWDDDDHKCLQIDVNGKKVFKVHTGEPEDNALVRNFSDCWNIPELLKTAFEAGQSEGKDGTFEIETTNEDPNE